MLSYIPGWTNNIPAIDDEWRVILESVKTFHTEHGRYPEPYTSKNDDSEKLLSHWCEKQRSVKSMTVAERGSVHWSVEKEAALNALPLWYWLSKDSNESFW